MAWFKCPYCGAITDKDGICRECDVGRVMPYYGEPGNESQTPTAVIYDAPQPKCVTAKLVIGILSMVMFFIIGFQSCAVNVGDIFLHSGEAGGSFGILVAINLLASGIIAVAARKSVKMTPWIINTVLLWLNYFYAKMFRGTFHDLLIWGFLSFAAGVFFLLSAMRTKKQFIIAIVVSAIYLVIALL